MYIRKDKTYDEYSRQVNDILTLLGTIGGLWGSFLTIGFFIVGFIA